MSDETVGVNRPAARRRRRVGRVVSDRMNQTVVVLVGKRRPHPRYGRIVNHRTKFMAHDETNRCRIGDLVEIEESRPLSRRKCWRVISVLESREPVELPAEVAG